MTKESLSKPVAKTTVKIINTIADLPNQNGVHLENRVHITKNGQIRPYDEATKYDLHRLVYTMLSYKANRPCSFPDYTEAASKLELGNMTPNYMSKKMLSCSYAKVTNEQAIKAFWDTLHTFTDKNVAANIMPLNDSGNRIAFKLFGQQVRFKLEDQDIAHPPVKYNMAVGVSKFDIGEEGWWDDEVAAN
jgi:hypothetical protein